PPPRWGRRRPRLPAASLLLVDPPDRAHARQRQRQPAPSGPDFGRGARLSLVSLAPRLGARDLGVPFDRGGHSPGGGPSGTVDGGRSNDGTGGHGVARRRHRTGAPQGPLDRAVVVPDGFPSL